MIAYYRQIQKWRRARDEVQRKRWNAMTREERGEEDARLSDREMLAFMAIMFVPLLVMSYAKVMDPVSPTRPGVSSSGAATSTPLICDGKICCPCASQQATPR